MSFSKTFGNRSLRKCLPIKLVRLVLPDDHLEQQLWQSQLQEFSLQQNDQKQEQQLSATVPDNKLLQLHLSQLCQQDPDPEHSRQLPEEPLSASGLRTTAWPATVQTAKPSFSKKKPADQDLSNISLDKFFPENFGKQLPEQQLQQNNFQQLSLEHPSFTEKIVHKELAPTFAKNSLIDNLVFQNFFFATLALQKVASEQLGENNLDKKQLAETNFPQTEEACKEQLLTTGFPEASLNQQPFSNSLVQPSGAKAASQPELLQRELQKKSLQTRTLTRTPWQQPACQQELQQDSFRRTSLKKRTLQRTALRHFAFPAFQEQLAKENFYKNSFYSNSFPAATSK